MIKIILSVFIGLLTLFLMMFAHVEVLRSIICSILMGLLLYFVLSQNTICIIIEWIITRIYYSYIKSKEN